MSRCKLSEVTQLTKIQKEIGVNRLSSSAAFETTVTSIRIFILAMVMRPDIQKIAQQELDSVVGFDQLPDFSDRDKLPYLSAILKESLR
jgi:cytochrome P450